MQRDFAAKKGVVAILTTELRLSTREAAGAGTSFFFSPSTQQLSLVATRCGRLFTRIEDMDADTQGSP